jgi:L-threonylcarbamoyladenylate synthase
VAPAPIVGEADPRALSVAAEVLRSGGTVALATDTVYGIAAVAEQAGAVAKLFAVKDRPDTVPIAVLVADLEQARELGTFDERSSALCAEHWPGALTVVVRRRPGLELELGGPDDTVGLRCPDRELVRALAREVGPLATTSANRHGRHTPTTAAEVARELGDGVELVIDGGSCAGVASTVVDLTGPRAEVLRHGSVAL